MEWISVKERLPEPFKNVLIIGDRGRYAISCVDNDGYIDDYGLGDDETPKFWMPLPESPTEK